jgi:uncharacterized protein
MLRTDAIQKTLFCRRFYLPKFWQQVLILLFITPPLSAASFNCQKASTDVERMICEKPLLSEADKRMANAYHQLRKVLPKLERQLLKQDQRQWLNFRDFELLNCTEPHCEVHFYEIRIKQLGPIAQTNLNCQNPKKSVEKMICSSRLLRHADGRIIKLYNDLQNELKENHFHIKSEVLKQDQEGWRTLRHTELSQPYCKTPCAWRFFQRRIEFLVRYRF